MYEKLLEHNHEWHKEYEKQSVQADEQVRRKLQDWKTKERKERVLLEEWARRRIDLWPFNLFIFDFYVFFMGLSYVETGLALTCVFLP